MHHHQGTWVGRKLGGTFPRQGARKGSNDSRSRAAARLLETDGLPLYEGPHSLLDALVSPGGLVGMRLRDIRALATLCKLWKTTADGQEVWRLCCAMLAREHRLCARSSYCCYTPT